MHQREVLVAIVLNDGPIDVLAERLNTTPGRPLQDGARRPAEVAGRVDRSRAQPRRPTGLDVSEPPPNEPGRLLARLTGPTGPELSCEECFEQLDFYVELELTTSDTDAAISGMRAHLEGCSACAEDRESLRALLLSDSG